MTKASSYFKSRCGFTLIELIVVVVIVGVLASIALPNYAAFKEKAMTTEALNAIDAIKAAQILRRAETGSYVWCYTTSDISTKLGVTLNSTNWTYESGTNMIVPGGLFTATAYRTVANGGNNQHWITYAWDNGALTGTWSGTHPYRPRNANGT